MSDAVVRCVFCLGYGLWNGDVGYRALECARADLVHVAEYPWSECSERLPRLI